MITSELMLDGNARQNLATFCTTWEDKPVRQLMNLTMSKNMIDKDEYPQSAEIEMRCVQMIANLWHSPRAAATIGTGRYTITPEKLEEVCDENTIGVVATLGLTFTGHYDPVESIQTALDQLEAKSGLNVPIHVDAASGGFVAPFVDPDLKWDFRLPRMHSINASGHKYGLDPLGVGWAVWRSVDELPDELIFSVDYLGGRMPTFALNFSRPGGQVIAQYYQFLRFGRKGYSDIMQSLRRTAVYIADELEKLGVFQIVHNGSQGIPVVTWRMKPGIYVPFNLFDLCHELRTSGRPSTT